SENNTKNDIWLKSTPGIFVKKFFNDFSFIAFYKSLALESNFLIINNIQIEEEMVDNLILNKEIFHIKDDDFFIIPTFPITKEISNIIDLFKKKKNTKYLSFSKIKDMEDIILYINFKKDQQITLKK
ncbi:MAG: hypothetical protein ACFFC3_11640, partial [Candidatus Odinarchaeota archaeon]